MTGIILAGGMSRRAKTNKLTLLVDDKPLILHTVDSMKNYVNDLVVVTGHYDNELRPILKDVKVIYNKDYELGMFSSVLAGIKNIDDDVLILPGDMMNISPRTFETILSHKGVISIPTYRGKRGHPLFLNKDMVELLKKEPVESNLREFITKHEDKVNLIEVDDPYIELDIDTIEDFNRFLANRKELTYEG